jgi:predicted Zn-dependent peptidase
LLKNKEVSFNEDYSHFLEPRKEVFVVNEKSEFKDSALSLVYKVKDMSEDDFTKLNIVSNLLSSMSCRLLQKVLRDEFELVYSASSCCHMRSGVLEITAYINKNNKDLVIEKIKEIVLSKDKLKKLSKERN